MKSMIRGLMVGAMVLAWSGCVLDDGFLKESGLFYCEVTADCPESGFTCNVTENECIPERDLKSVCMDMDEDGYGVGDDRTECRFPAVDTDDTDAAIYPGAVDICDGKDNDQDGTTDVIKCTGTCSQTAGPTGSIGFCESGVCVYKPRNTATDGCNRALMCNGEAGFEPVPDECM